MSHITDSSTITMQSTYTPIIKDCVQIRHSWDGVEILVPDDEGGIAFKRIDKRWRFRSGPYCSVHHVASAIFDYPPNPSKMDIELMVNCLACFCHLADSFCFSAKEYYEREHKKMWQSNQFDSFIIEPTQRCDFLYLMKHANGLVKIGRSANPTIREKTLQAEDPNLCLIAQFQDCGKYEKRLHRIFSELRVRGEWFDLETRHIDWIKLVFATHH